MKPPLRTIGLVLAMVAGIAGCAPARPAMPAVSVAMVDMATRSGTWPGTQDMLATAIATLNRKCLAAQGFAVSEAPIPAETVPEDEAAIINLGARKANGYGLAAEITPEKAKDPSYSQLSPADQERYLQALLGPPDKIKRIDLDGGPSVVVREQGCEAVSRQRLTGDVATWARLAYVPQVIDDRLAEQARTAPAYLAALAAWRSCMTQRGFHYQSPEQAHDSIRAAYRGPGRHPQLRQREISVAVADGECAARIHLPTIALTARRDLAASLPRRDLRTLADLVTRRDTALSRAKSVIAAG